MKRRGLLLAVLVYVTLDLSLPAMPGAFEFDPAQSVESAQRHRTRATVDIVVAPARAGDPEPLPPCRVAKAPRPDAIPHARRSVGSALSRRPRAASDGARPADDPPPAFLLRLP